MILSINNLLILNRGINMHKKIILLLLLSTPLVGCDEPETVTLSAEKRSLTNTSPTKLNKEPLAKIALDWDGTYTGILPCANCEGIDYQLTLHNNNTYTLIRHYEGLKNSIAKSPGIILITSSPLKASTMNRINFWSVKIPYQD